MRFHLRELEAAIQTVSELPETWPRFKMDYRRFLLSKFPYSVIYRDNKKTVFIVAVMHNSSEAWLLENSKINIDSSDAKLIGE